MENDNFVPTNLWLLNNREHSKNFKSEDMQTQIEGKNCIVTGANSGIGYATAEGLASRYGSCFHFCILFCFLKLRLNNELWWQCFFISNVTVGQMYI